MDLIPFLQLDPLLEWIIVSLAVMVLSVSLYVVSAAIRMQRRNERIAGLVKAYRVYKINLTSGEVTFFDFGKSRLIRRTTLNDFLMQYPFEDLDRVQQWLNQLFTTPSDTPWFLETAGTKKIKNKNLFTLLEVTKLDQERKIIHMHSHLLSVIKPRKGKKTTEFKNALPLENAQAMLKRTQPSVGAIYDVHFSFSAQISEDNQKLSGLYLTQIKNRLRDFLSPYLRMLDTDNGLTFLNLKPNAGNEHIQMAYSILSTVQKYLEVNALKDDIHVGIGIVEHRHFARDLTRGIALSSETSQLAVQRNLKYDLYNPSQTPLKSVSDPLDIDVKKIVQEKALTFRYRAIFDTSDSSIFGFFTYIQPESKRNLNSLQFQKLVANHSSSRDTMNYMVKTVIDQTAKVTLSETKQRIFMALSVYQKNFLTQNLAASENLKRSNLVIVFEENEIRDAETAKGILALVEAIKGMGLEVALAFANSNLLLGNEIYQVFDYFVFDARLTLGIDEDQRKLLSIRTIIDRLAPFKKPFIACDMAEITSLELLDNLGVKLLSAEIIAPLTPNFEIPDKKIVNRLKQFSEKKKSTGA